jgi:hypothetical protein
MKRALLLTLALAVLAAACGDAKADTGDTTTTGDGRQALDPAYVETVALLFLESYPVQVRAVVTGNLPTPCHTLRWDLAEDGDTIVLELSASYDPTETCAQVLEPFEVTVDVGSFETGSYTLMVNGEAHPFDI